MIIKANFVLQASLIVLMGCVLTLPGPASADSDADPAQLAVAGRLGDMTLGDKNAPVTVYEYGSFTCPHCAGFATDTFPEFKKNYIDTGKSFYVFRAFGFHKDPLGMTAAMLAQCAGPKHHMDFIAMFFRTRKEWSNESPKEGVEELKQLVMKEGVSGEDVDKCIKNEIVFNHVHEVEQRAAKEFHVSKTPTFFINGERFSGDQSYEDLAEALDKHLAH